MTKTHLFVMDPLEDLNLGLDSSLRMMSELAKIGHQCFHCTPHDLGWSLRAATAHARSQSVTFGDTIESVKFNPVPSKLLNEFDAIHMRKDPPYDLDYITCTWILDSAYGKVRIFNSPQSLRNLNEKLSIFHFKETAAAGLVSSDTDEIVDFIRNEADGDGILKPLTLFGGRGVERLQLADGESEIRTRLATLTENGKSLRLIQPFDPAVFEGEIRVFTAFAEPLAWCLKRPKSGEFLANTRAGATLESYFPTPDEEDRVRAVAEALLLEGVAFIGFDVIGGYISEINLTSPRLLVPPGDTHNYYADIARLIDDDLAH